MNIIRKVANILFPKRTTSYFWNLRTKAKTARNPLVRKYYYEKQYRYMEKNCAGISIGAEFASAPVLPHGVSGIFVSEGARIGESCVIFHQVTIGSNTLKDSSGQGSPVIGDHVYIGCGAKIIGGVKIGNHARIGANCVVTRDIPDNATVVLERPRVLVREVPGDNTFLAHSQM